MPRYSHSATFFNFIPLTTVFNLAGRSRLTLLMKVTIVFFFFLSLSIQTVGGQSNYLNLVDCSSEHLHSGQRKTFLGFLQPRYSTLLFPSTPFGSQQNTNILTFLMQCWNETWVANGSPIVLKAPRKPQVSTKFNTYLINKYRTETGWLHFFMSINSSRKSLITY